MLGSSDIVHFVDIYRAFYRHRPETGSIANQFLFRHQPFGAKCINRTIQHIGTGKVLSPLRGCSGYIALLLQSTIICGLIDKPGMVGGFHDGYAGMCP